MKPMYQILAESGVNLSNNVVVIVEAETMMGDMTPTAAYRGHVLPDLPVQAIDQFKGYDPLYDVVLCIPLGTGHGILVFSLPDGGCIFTIEGGGVIFHHEAVMMIFGQSPQLFALQSELATRLSDA
ncbi:MAG: hypothetical protein RLZZ70_604 [Candidatus Parcubacteria bacterium]|jgi:hypothetical protein